MGASQSIQTINFEDIHLVIKNPESYMLINTLPSGEQEYLIPGTISCDQEESLINKYVKLAPQTKIVVYGKNCNDETVQKKYHQLVAIGFPNVYVYSGGLFEWSLLQEIYSAELFPTTSSLSAKELLKYKPAKKLNISFIDY